jgi:SET domain-containing protein
LDKNWATPKAEARKTSEKGMGNFAVEPIKRGETVAGFGGWSLTRDELNTLSMDRQHRSIQIDENLYLVSDEDPERGDFFNHSCEPNCVLLGSQILLAWRDIAIGEELTFDYATCDDSDYDEFQCGCDTSSCRGTVTGQDWKRPELQEKYDGHFSSYLARRIAKEKGENVL